METEAILGMNQEAMFSFNIPADKIPAQQLITDPIKKKIQNTVSVFETSSLKPRYDIIALLHDGPKGIKQVTYGKHQTTEFGNLKALLEKYSRSLGRYSKDFIPYLSKIGVTPLADNQAFINLLRYAGTDIVMHEVQDAFFDQYYWNPALSFFLRNGFRLPLSMLVIYDSYIHSGSIPSWLRNDFKEKVPAAGGDEKAWTTSYVTTRDNWLEHHPNKVLQNTDYRTDCMLAAIQAGNWDLSGEIVCKFNQKDPHAWITIK
jgi:chitosanase